MSTKDMKIIGRSTKISFIDSDIKNLPAKVDTGAYSSAVWATKISEKQGILSYTLLDPTSPYYSGKRMSTKNYRVVDVENSFGISEDRYAVRLNIELEGITTRATFTLASRKIKSYPALIGRRFLRDKYLVDVAHGIPRPKKVDGEEA